jgi:hypothetical protein
MDNITAEAVTQIRIKRSGSALGIWTFDEKDARVIFDTLKEYFEPQA